jgi:hypothetical protein
MSERKAQPKGRAFELTIHYRKWCFEVLGHDFLGRLLVVLTTLQDNDAPPRRFPDTARVSLTGPSADPIAWRQSAQGSVDGDE